MKLALITVTRNDDFRLDDWCNYYEEYKNDVALHVIVDDASEKDYLNSVKNHFKDSVIIERKINGGSNAALNDALKYVLQIEDIDAIMVLDNDIKLKKGTLQELYAFLYSENELGMVAPIVLKRDSDIIEDFGVKINLFRTSMLFQGHLLSEIPQNKKMFVDAVPGGINMAKPSFYRKVGLQDETIFMYCDERDMSYRSKRYGFKEGVTSCAVAWHQHQSNPQKGKKLRSDFLIARNRIYLQKKFLGKGYALLSAFYTIFALTRNLLFNIKDKTVRWNYSQRMKGIKNGLLGNMDNSHLWI